jgi:hypothetical protein
MTAPKSAAAKARARYLAAARRSLKLIITEAAIHDALLGEGKIPETGFLASALKYDQALAALAALDALDQAPAGDGDDGTAEVRRDDLQALIWTVRGIIPPGTPGDGTPLGRLAAASGEPPWAPDPAAGQGS